MKIDILNPQALRAAALSAAKKDIRRYLNGVCIRYRASVPSTMPFAMCYGSDGHRVGCFRTLISEWIDTDFEVIVPLDVIKSIPKKANSVELVKLDDKQWRLGNTLFTPVEGRYPDIVRVIPQSFDNKLANVNPEYLLDAYEAMKIYRGKDYHHFLFETNALGACAVHDGQNDAFVVIMPMRVDTYVFQGLPAEYR